MNIEELKIMPANGGDVGMCIVEFKSVMSREEIQSLLTEMGFNKSDSNKTDSE